MGAKVHTAKVLFRRWEQDTGMAESEETFMSLDELFEICLHRTEGQPLIDRIILEGQDDAGHIHRLVFNFQSVSE